MASPSPEAGAQTRSWPDAEADADADRDQSPLLLETGGPAQHTAPTQTQDTGAAGAGAGACAWRAGTLFLVGVAMLLLAALGTMHWTTRIPETAAMTTTTVTPTRAWVLGSRPERLASSTAAIKQAFPSLDLAISSVPMVPLTDPRIQNRHRADSWLALPVQKRPNEWEYVPPPMPPNGTKELRWFSTSIGWMDMWTRAGADQTLDEDEWMLMFEDDIALVPQPAEAGPQPFDYTPALLELFAQPAVQSDGIVYLGACGPEWAPLDPPPLRALNQLNASSAPDWLSSRRGVAWCTHALALTKRRARTLASDLATFLHTSLTLASDANLRLLFLATARWPFILGADRQSPLIPDHMGIFYQDRAHHKSIIEQNTPPTTDTTAASTNAKDNKQKPKSDTAKQTQKPTEKKQAAAAATAAAANAVAALGASASASSISTTGAARGT